MAALVGGGLAAVALAPAAGAAVRTPVAKPVTMTVVTKAAAAGCATGKYQKSVEYWLNKIGGFGKLSVDGKQSAGDCAAIKKFQQRFGIQPAQGLAGPTTFDVARRLGSTNVAACKAGKSGFTFCVDLTQQT